MAVCNDKACEAILCGDCKDLIPSMCGDRVPNIVEGSCSAIRFEGVGDVSINQGECIDLTEGVHAYDGNGSEIEYTVTPSEIPCCGVGEYEVKYSAVGIGNKMLPSFCTNAFMLMLSDCGMDTKSVLRKIIVNAIVSPIISGIDTVCIGTDTLFNPMSGVSAVDGNGNTLEVDHNGIYDQVASGSIASFESVGGNIKSLIASIEPVQSGTGTPSPDNVRPISGHDSVVVNRTGKNLIDLKSLLLSTGTYVDGVLTDSVTNLYRAFKGDSISNSLLPMPIHGQLAISAKAYTDGNAGTDGNGLMFVAKYTDGTIQYLIPFPNVTSSAVYQSAVTNASKEIASIGIGFGKYGANIWHISELQIELGSTATAYEPYAGQTYTTDLGRTVYGGSLDVVSGVLTVDRAMVVLDGSSDEVWRDYTRYNGFFIQVPSMKKGTLLQSGIANSFPTLTAFGTQVGIAFGSGTNDIIYVLNVTGSIDGVTDNASWRTYLAQNPLQVCYELASPQTYQLTPQQVTALLGDNAVWADTGDVAVTYPIEMPDGAFTFPTDGAYEITYHAEDECGNETTETRLIVVGSENSVCEARVCCASTEEC